MDLITGLPSFQSFTVIFVVVDHFSKAAHFGMLPTNFTAVQVAELFAKMICKLHMPKSIMSNRDPVFLIKFWQELFQFSGTKLRMSTTYHPQVMEVAFELELPPASRIHHVFHVSHLKPCKGLNTATLELPL